MLLIILLIIFISMIAIGIMGDFKKYKFLIMTNFCFFGMLFALLLYYVKIGGFTNNHSQILFGTYNVLNIIKSIPVNLDTIANIENICRVGFAYFFFLYAAVLNATMKKYYNLHKYMYFISAVPLLLIMFFTNSNYFYENIAFNYSLQNLIVNIAYAVIFLYLLFSIILVINEYKVISLSWNKARHRNNMISMFLLSIPYLIFSQFDPVIIYQDYYRVFVQSKLILMIGSHSLSVWVGLFSICIVALIMMVFQTYEYLRYDYDSTKLEMTIKKKVTNVEITSTMLMHGLKNQLLSAKILSKKIQKGLISNDKENYNELVENANDLVSVNVAMLDKIGYLYRSITEVKTLLVATKIDELFEKVKSKIAKKNLGFIVEYQIEEGIILADKELLSEAINNLIMNAIDEVREKKDGKVLVKLFYTRNHTIISVKDNGNGINKSMKNRIFLPLVSSKNTNTNWGLGLCYARQIVKKHMGEIRFETEVGKGTEFFITLPRYIRRMNEKSN